MKSLLRFWLIFALVLLTSWFLASYVESRFTNNDGIISGISIRIFFQYLSGFAGTVALCTLGIKSRIRIISNISVSLFSLLFFWGFGELLCMALIHFHLVDAPKPFHSRVKLSDEWISLRRPFWGDYSPSFGRWRRPDDSISITPVHGKPIQIRANAFGMRDRERTQQNTTSQKRVVLVGDSFVEGYIVQEEQRFSNLLEKKTGIEHLNFGINGTSVINYYLTYKHLVKQFDHDVVLVSILPANDFEDYDAAKKTELLRYPIYRPYWEGQFPDVKLDYSLADVSQSLSTGTSYDNPVQTREVIDSVYHTLPLKDKIIAELKLNSYLLSCTFHWAGQVARLKQKPLNSFAKSSFEERWPAFAYSLEQLARESLGKEVIFYAVPIRSDLEAYQQDKTDDLSPRLEKLCRLYGITYINLLPVFYAQGEANWERFYQEGDGHWTPEGERFVSEVLMNHPAYRRAIQGRGNRRTPRNDLKTEPVYLSDIHEKTPLPAQGLPSPEESPSSPAPTATDTQSYE